MNVVPLVDVVLVLLIIFMVTSTFSRQTGMGLQLPSSSATQDRQAAGRELVIGVGPRGEFLWNSARVTDARLLSDLRSEAARGGTESRVTIRGDKRATHGSVVRAMSLAQQAGFSRLVIATTKE